MKNVLYTKRVQHDPQQGTSEHVTLTEELNRLVLWSELRQGEDEQFIVIKTFGLFELNTAIETAVKTAIDALNDARPRVFAADGFTFDAAAGEKVVVRLEPIRDDTRIEVKRAANGATVGTFLWSESLLAEAFLAFADEVSR